MSSLILTTATRLVTPLLLVFSVFLLLRGHNEPGGGFVGGLVAAAAFALHAIAFGTAAARRLLRVDPRALIASGLGLALASGLVSVARDPRSPFMTGTWFAAKLPVVGKVGTPVFFDTGVYVLVVGVTLTIVLALAEE